MSLPRVTCVMPTRNRRRFVGQALWYFLRQDYQPRELIVLDDGDDPIEDLIPASDTVRYVRLERRRAFGDTLNLACELSQGELIAHWYDDDWQAPDRLSRQVAALEQANADLCGAPDLLYYRVNAGEAWHYCPNHGSRWLAGGTLLYRRDAWAAHPFPSQDTPHAAGFSARFTPDRIAQLHDPAFYIGVLHTDNAAPRSLTAAGWQRRPLDEVAHRLNGDGAFYVNLRQGKRGAAPRPATQTAGLTVVAPFMVYDGYGSLAEYLVLGLARTGVPVHIAPLGLDPQGLSPELIALSRQPVPPAGGPVLCFSWLREDIERHLSTPDLFINTMWETSELPRTWPAWLNRSRAVIVPTRFVADTCRGSGVSVPIAVIPEGVDPAVYHWEERPERAGLTTLMVGPYALRKHTAEGIAAWKLAFDGDPDARLIIKSRFHYRNYMPDDPRILFLDDNEPTRGIVHWYREADVLLALGNEGFGLPLVEGMATGLPVIALNSEGQADVCAEAGDCVLAVEPARFQPYNVAPHEGSGVIGVPDVTEVAARLRWVAEHRDEARGLGRAASDWATEHRNIWHKAPAVADILEAHLRPPRPLRRMDTFWTPSWGRACGVAEYTADLLAHVDTRRWPLKVTAAAPDLRSTRLLHIQHEDSLFSDSELARAVVQARGARVPVIVTEHSVRSQPRSWEQEASALVSLTRRGAEMLKARWPRQRVEHIPYGCHTWFPPRKQTRGAAGARPAAGAPAVIGAFGFLEAYKGFWKLLDALRTLQGSGEEAELLLFSHSKSVHNETTWEQAAAGLPVRRVREYVPAEEVCRRLAADADILVFWYDDIPYASASGAVHVGLASGVPVLTSATRWFEELAGATYQPSDLVQGIRRLLDDTKLRDETTSAARAYCHANSCQRSAERHLALWESLR